MHDERHWWWQRPFLYVGRMAEDKGVSKLIQAWKELKNRYPKYCPPLWLAGGSPDEIDKIRVAANLTGTIGSFEREGSIHWWGYLDPPGLSALLSRTCVLVTHSRYEPGGRVVIEAMTQGVPVIATPNGFAKDLIKDWRNGFLVKFGDTATLICRMAHFIHQPLLRNSLGAEARETARKALGDWDFLGKHCEAYDQAIEHTIPNESETTKVASTRHRCYHQRRRILPTYPHAIQTPTSEVVQAFAKKHIGAAHNLQRIKDGPGSSLLWRLSNKNGEWIVKWPYPRLVLRGLWDPFGRNQFLTPAKDRFERELFSGTLPGFCPWTGNDPDTMLLMRPYSSIQPATVLPEIFIELATCYKKLYSFPLPSFPWANELNRDWNQASEEEVLEFRNRIRENLRATPWDADRHVSVRLAWREAVFSLEHAKNPAIMALAGQYQEYIEAFCFLANVEMGLDLCVSHGSGDLSHCLRVADGSLKLIDGEHVHPSQPGEDMAATIFYAIEDAGEVQNEKRIWIELLNTVAADRQEADLLLTWAGLLAFEDMKKQVAMLYKDRQTSLARWETLGQMALGRINQ